MRLFHPSGLRITRRVWLLALLPAALALSAPARADVEDDVGKVTAKYFEQQYGLCRDPRLSAWAERVGQQVAAQSDRDDLHCRFGVLNSGEMNAWSLPGGYIYCSAALLGHLDSEDELAGVLAHEVGHQQDRDFQRTSLREGLWLGVGALALRKAQDYQQQGWAVFELLDGLGESREHEAEADHVGTLLSARAGYDPGGLADFLQTISTGEKKKWSYWETLLETHPHPAYREKWVQTEITGLLPPEKRVELAANLADRGRVKQALVRTQEALQAAPDLPAAHEEAARLYLAQGRLAEARDEVARASALAPQDPVAAALAAQVALAVPPPPPVPWQPSPALRQRLADAQAALEAQDADRTRLRAQIARELNRLSTISAYNEAVQTAQGLVVTNYDWTQLTLLGQAVLVMQSLDNLAAQVNEMRWLEYDLPNVLLIEQDKLLQSQSAYRNPAEYDHAGDRLVEAMQLAHDRHVPALRALARTSTKLRRIGLEVTPILVELSVSSDSKQLGNILWIRGAVVETQLALANRDLQSARKATDSALEDLCEVRDAQYAAVLARLGAGATPAEQGLYQVALGATYQVPAEQVAEAWAAQGDLGDASRQLIQLPPPPPGQKVKTAATRNSSWNDAPYAGYVLLRLGSRRCADEEVTSPPPPPAST